ncbi:MAG: response regulator transcription factor [Chitinophagales bacterium]|mgnify:FL=1
MKTNDIRIIVADDHKLFRKGLISILSDLPQVSVIAEAENGEQLLNILKTTPTDIVLLDLRMPLMDGYEVLAIVKSKFPTVKAIVISMFDAESHIVNAIEAGAKGFLTKDSDPEEIAIAIESVFYNNFYFNEKSNIAMLNRLLKRSNINPHFNDNGTPLLETELNILKLICEELTSEEIAKRVFLSKKRVDAIRLELMKKIGVSNVAGLVLYAVRNNIVA